MMHLHKTNSARTEMTTRLQGSKDITKDDLIQSLHRKRRQDLPLQKQSLELKQTTTRQPSERTAATMFHDSAPSVHDEHSFEHADDERGEASGTMKSQTSNYGDVVGRSDQPQRLPVDDFDALRSAADGSAMADEGSITLSLPNDNEDEKESQTAKPMNRFRDHGSFWKGVRKFRNVCGAFVNDDRVQLVMVILIVINAIMMGVATFSFVTDNEKVNNAFQKTDEAFLSLFTIELGLQLIYHGFHLFLDGWLLFDFCIIIMSWSLESMQVIRAFRVFRAVRLVTRLKALKNLLIALFAVAPSMAGIVALLLLIMYIYAVMCTVLFKPLYSEGVTDEDYFGSLFASLFTLFQMMTLENWAAVVRQVQVSYSWAWAVFSSYLLMTSFILYSLIIAVVCDAVKVTEHQDEKEEQLREQEVVFERVTLLENAVADMAEQQLAIVENLHFALQALENLDNDDESDDTAGDEDDDLSGSGTGTSFHEDGDYGSDDANGISLESATVETRTSSKQKSTSASVSRGVPKGPQRLELGKESASTSRAPQTQSSILSGVRLRAAVERPSFSEASTEDSRRDNITNSKKNVSQSDSQAKMVK
jgi:hypothetical protein